MNRKHNPLVSLTALVLLATILVMACTGCTAKAEAEESETPPRFTSEYMGGYICVITDNETGVQYMAYNGHGLVKLEAGHD